MYTKVAEDQQIKVRFSSISLALYECVFESIRVHDMYYTHTLYKLTA